MIFFFFFFQAEDGIRDTSVTGVQSVLFRSVYGPIGAFLAEYFPGRIRYTSVSVPYHIGNGWGGGLVPLITTAAFQATHSLGSALIYPIAVPAVCFVLALILMPETRHNSIWKPLEG